MLGVGFNRCTSLHYAESLVPNRRTMISRFPIIENGIRVRVEKLSTRALVDFAAGYFREVLTSP